MKQPPDNYQPSPGTNAVQVKTMFYNEGNPSALLILNRSGRRLKRAMKFATAEAALGWCRRHATVLVYLPVNLAAN